MSSRHVLAGLARRLNREAGAPPLPALFFMTDPERTPDPLKAARKLPRGAAVIYRHFGASNRVRTARRLAAFCRSRGLFLLISADPELAQNVCAHGVHWPEARMPDRRETAGIVTAAAHSAAALARARAFGADACVVGPVFPTHSASGRTPLGVFRASQLARAAGVPVIALGGINKKTARRLAGRGFAGIAAVDALSA